MIKAMVCFPRIIIVVSGHITMERVPIDVKVDINLNVVTFGI